MADRRYSFEIVGDTSKLDRSLDGSRKQLDGMETSAASLVRGLASLGGGAIGIGLITSRVRALGTELIQAQSNADRLNLQFRAGFGASRAGQELQFVRDTANALGLEVLSVAEQYSKFAAATRGTSLQGQATREIFQATAESAAVLGLNIDETGGILRAFQQIASKGRVQMEELSGQLGDRLTGALGKAARAMGVTTAELLDMVQKGEVVATEFLPKLAKIMRDDVADGAELAATRMDAFVNRLANAQQQLGQDVAASGVGEFIAGQLAVLSDGITGVSEAYAQARKEGSGFVGQTAAAAGAVLSFLNPFNAFSYSAQSLTGRLEDATRALATLKEQAASDPGGSFFPQAIAEAEQYIATLQAAQAAQRGIVGAGQGRGNGQIQLDDHLATIRREEEARERRMKAVADVTAEVTAQNDKYVKSLGALQAAFLAGDFKGREKEYVALVERLAQANKPKAERTGGSLDKALKVELQARLREIKLAADAELDAVRAGQQALQDQYDDALMSAAEFYTRRAALAEQGVQAQQRAFDREIEQFRRVAATARDPDTRIDAENRLAETIAKRAQAEQRAVFDVSRAERERARTLDELRQRLADVATETLALQGREAEADALRSAARVREFARLGTQAGIFGDDDRAVQSFEHLLRQANQFAQIQRELSDLSREAQRAEEAYLLAAQSSGAGLEEVERGVFRVRQASLAQLEEQLRKTQALAEASDDPRIKQFAADLALQYQRAVAEVDPLLQRLNSFAERAGDTLAANMAQAVTEGERLSDILKRIGHQLLQLVAEEAFTKPLAASISAALRSNFSSTPSAGGGFLDALLGAAAGYFGRGNYSGVTAGGGGFAAPSGIAPLATGTNYVPRTGLYMLHEGEAVQPKEYNPAAGGGAGGTVINVHNYAGAQVGQSSRTGPDGRTVVDLVIKAVAGDISGGGGQVSAALKSRGVNLSGALARRG